MDVIWRAPLFDVTGYANEARSFVLGLDALGARVRASPIDWGFPHAPLRMERRERLRQLTRTRVGSAAIRVEHCFPPHWRTPPSGAVRIGRTMFETDRIPDDWVPHCNTAHEVWVPSDFNLETFAAAGVRREKLVVVPEAIRAADYDADVVPLDLGANGAFTFLSVFDWSWRKGWDLLVRAYCAQFSRAHDHVILALRVHSSYGLDAADIRRRIRRFMTERLHLLPQRAPDIVVLGVLPEEAMPRLYRAADCYVLPTRGEGWGRPFAEAMAAGVPVIGTRWGGQTHFMHDRNAHLIDVEALVRVPPHALREAPAYRGHRWAEPSVEHLGQLMRRVYERSAEAKVRALEAAVEIKRTYDAEVVCRGVIDRLSALAGAR
jgi:glycosyltransferase involved in cell wall biosynthesis